MRGDGTLLEFERVADAVERANLRTHRGTRHASRLAKARAVARRLMRLEPIRLATFTRRRQPFRRPETGAAYLEGLRAAGLPD